MSRAGSLPYLLSAALVLLGGYLQLFAGGPSDSIGQVFSAQLAYQALLLLAVGYLLHRRKDDALAIAWILTLFLLDLSMVQQRFGWEYSEGIRAAWISFSGAALVTIALAALLKLPLTSRLPATLLATVAFIRFGPILVVGHTEPVWGVSPAYVWLSWVMAACLLPSILLPTARPEKDQSLRRIEEWGLATCFCALLLHGLLAGISSGLVFHLAYLAPSMVLLPAVIRRTQPAALESPGRKLLLAYMPVLAIAFSAAEVTPGLFDRTWCRTWPLTPIALVLLAVMIGSWIEARRSESSRQWTVTAALGCCLLLGSDLPEALARLFFPELWQVPVIIGLCVASILLLKTSKDSEDFWPWLLIPSIVLGSSWLAILGYPRAAAFSILLAWTSRMLHLNGHDKKILALLSILRPNPPERWPVSLRWLRLSEAFLLTILPTLVMLRQADVGIRFGVFAFQCIAASFIGRWSDDSFLRRAGMISLLFVLPTQISFGVLRPEIPTGTLLMYLGFAVLAIGMILSLHGRLIQFLLRRWWISLRSESSAQTLE